MAEATTTLATAHFIETWRTRLTTIVLVRMDRPTNLGMSSVKSILAVFKRTLAYKNPTRGP
jgi:hypothetical protein